MKYIYRINGEERFPTDEERKKLYRQFMRGLGYRPVEKKEDLGGQEEKGNSNCGTSAV